MQYAILAFLLVIGPGMLVAAPVSYVRRRNFLKRSVRVTGSVTEARYQRTRENGNDLYRLTVRFPLPDGRTREFTEADCDEREVGDEVAVLYDPDRPEAARVGYGEHHLRERAAVMAAIGATGTILLIIFVALS